MSGRIGETRAVKYAGRYCIYYGSARCLAIVVVWDKGGEVAGACHVLLQLVTSMSDNLTFLQIVQRCDNFDSPSEFDSEKLIPLYLLDPQPPNVPIGLLRPVIVEQLKIENERNLKANLRQLWSIHEGYISFAAWADTPSTRTEAMKELCERWRDTGLFPNVCGPKKWRSELYPVYRDPLGPHNTSNFMFEMERSACALFGVVTYGVHMSIYQEIESQTNPEGRELKIWVPTRAKTKQTLVIRAHYLLIL